MLQRHPKTWGDADAAAAMVARMGGCDPQWLQSETRVARWRPAIAWLGLLVAGLSIGLTGPLDWRGLYAEYIVEFAALGTAGGLLWVMGLRSPAEGFSVTLTAVWTVAAISSVPLGRAAYWPAEAMLHLFLCVQLAAWRDEAIRLRASESYPVTIMLLGMFFETCTLVAKLIMPAPAACPPGAMWLTCYTAEPWQAFALPAAMTLAMLPWWVRPWPRRR
jgi:hypothetical protein